MRCIVMGPNGPMVFDTERKQFVYVHALPLTSSKRTGVALRSYLISEVKGLVQDHIDSRARKGWPTLDEFQIILFEQ